MNVSIAGAKKRLTQSPQRVQNGEAVTICRNGIPVADLVCTPARDHRPWQFGTLKDRTLIFDADWAKPQKDVEAWLRDEV